MAEEPEITTREIAATNNYVAWQADEPDGESTFHLELGLATLHFFKEEWEELLELMRLLID